MLSLPADDNLGVCWQEVGADLVCSRPRLDRQATYTECCCLYGEAWGMDCALCPAQDSGTALCLDCTQTPCLSGFKSRSLELLVLDPALAYQISPNSARRPLNLSTLVPKSHPRDFPVLSAGPTGP